MRYSKIPPRKTRSVTVSRFRGLNRQPLIREGEMAEMENLSSDLYPVLSPRKPRGTYRKPASPQGLIALDQVCYVDGADFVMGDTRVEMGLSVDPLKCPKRLQAMGAYVIILPDKKYINTEDPEDRGDIEARVTLSGAEISLCLSDGTEVPATAAGETAPEAPENGALWLDTAQSPPALMRYSTAQGSWAGVPDTLVRISGPGIGAGFAAGDGVRVEGCQAEQLNGSQILQAVQEDALLLEGWIEAPLRQSGALTVRRRMPELDWITEYGNRLWGCRFGSDGTGNRVNQIYASKLGDFRNWECFQGLSTDSYAASCGTPGPFTGAAAFGSGPVFFKETCLHRVYGTEPAAFCLQAQPCRGVQPGCGESLVQVGERLFYQSRFGICAYDGGAPELISRELGSFDCSRAVAGALGEKYYISLTEAGGGDSLLVYDTSRKLWHREDGLRVSAFCTLGQALYAIDSRSRNILTLAGAEAGEEAVFYSARTGPLGLEEPERKYIARLDVRMTLEAGSRMEIRARYDDSPTWEHLATVYSRELRSIRLPLRPRRCDHLALEISGVGGMKLYGITRIYERGSDQP